MGSSVARSLILIYKSGGLGWLKDVCLSCRTYYAKKMEIYEIFSSCLLVSLIFRTFALYGSLISCLACYINMSSK